MSRVLRCSAWILGCVLLTISGRAATLLSQGYALRVWQGEDGLPQSAVAAAAQTRDGYLWIATFGGLARFDGETFHTFSPANTPALRDGRVVSLFEDAQGTLWIGHESGIVTSFRDGRFESFQLPTNGPRDGVRAICNDERGRLWALRDGGALDCLEDDIHLPSLSAPQPPSVLAWTRSTKGELWVAVNGTAAHLSEGRLIPIAFDRPRRSDVVLGLAAASAGGIWVLRDDRIRRWADGHWNESLGGDEFPWGNATVSCSLELRDGTLAVGTVTAGLHLIFRDGRAPVRFDRRSGLPQDWVRFLFEDREGNLWCGVGSAGLAAIHSSAFSVLHPPDHWQGHSVLAVAPGRDGSLWIGTEGAGLYHYAAGEWTNYGPAEGLGNPYIWSVTEDDRGQVWAGTWTGGPFRLENGRFVPVDEGNVATGPVLALYADPKTRGLLAGNRDGLLRVVDDRAAWLVRATSDFSADVTAVLRDREGAIWLGFAHAGLARLDQGELVRYRKSDGLASDAVQCLLLDDDGSLWIGTADNGLSRLRDGRFDHVGVAHGLVSAVICKILDDGRGQFWLSTHGGIQRVTQDELRRCADGQLPAISGQTFDRGDALPTIEFTGSLQAAGCRTPDGRLWFPSSKGLVAVDPARIETNGVIPPVECEALLMDGNPIAWSSDSEPPRLPPHHQRLEFRYTALSFVAPHKVRFKYRLDGLDTAWVEAGNKRSAFYSQLPAGTYRFRVIGCNNDGRWNSEGASFAFTVAPFFWETWWFLGAAGFLVLSVVGWSSRYVTRRRLQRRMEQLEREQAVERERARIARDIHDDIGTTLTRIALLSQSTDRELQQPQQAAAVLSGIYDSTQEITRSLDEIVWAVDPRHDTLDSLATYMGRYAQDLLSAANLRCRLDLPMNLPAWPLTAEVRHNLFLALKETLNNILKHAHATEVRLSLRLQPPNAFVLRITDDGRGFDRNLPVSTAPERLSSGHGLPNLQRRLAGIGGRCEISADPGQGTTVIFTVTVTDQPSAATGQDSIS